MRPQFDVGLRLTAGALFTLLILSANLAAQATHGQRSHCHATDGAFSTCPDGSQEWSDVPAIAFPDTNSFLYADQANLDPTSQSPTPDTLMLLYDACGRFFGFAFEALAATKSTTVPRLEHPFILATYSI